MDLNTYLLVLYSMPIKDLDARREYNKNLKRKKRETIYALSYPPAKKTSHTYTLLHTDGSPSIFTITVPIKYIPKLSS